ncbi:hypothetical protein DOTSEDRAFT_68435 [Dothistroma septosporum NZE10]|uniref:Uncharacterized protein n=1 Tax=Dothistroma septosporum (strain NZE10 / CBS 128990) TaxID=675120 RepID=N1Q4R7_DOTSN|nr:hypothetical protein DOTSEDRAFT_68435 [Dothistroma septosporum NZE10]
MEPRDYVSFDAHPRIPRDPRRSEPRDEASRVKASALGHARSARQHDDRYDSPYHCPPTPTSDRRRQPQTSPPHTRRSWPPQPFAEDEWTSLRREVNAHQLLRRARENEAPSRGSVDQEPMILEVPEFINQHERRFVFAHSERKSDSSGIPTPPTSEDERSRKARRRPSKLTINGDGRVPEMDKRTSSPYAFTKPSRLPHEAANGSRYSSTEAPSPQSAGPSGTKTARLADNGKLPPSPRRDSARLSPTSRAGKDYLHAGNRSNDNDNAIDDSHFDSRRPPPRGKKMTDQPRSENSRTSVVDFAGQSGSAPPIRKANLDARRNTDSQGTLPTLGRLNTERSRRPTPLMASISLSEAQDVNLISTGSLDPRSAEQRPRSREASYASSRGVSPANSISSTSHSPRMSADRSREGSVAGSVPGSASASRPPSPTPRTPAAETPRLARTDLDWSALLAANTARRAKPPSRLAETISQEPTPEFPRRTTLQQSNVPRPTSLPYPEDASLMGGTILMPEEQEHAYMPSRKATLVPNVYESQNSARSASAAPSNSSHASARSAHRPSMIRGYSASNASWMEPRNVAEVRPRLAEVKRSESFATASETKKELQALMAKGLPPCPRPQPIAGYDDWYTVTGSSDIDFCPNCIDTLFERTVFRSQFRRSLPRNLDQRVQCAFGSPWIRLAWLLTLQQQRTDLGLLKDVAEIESTTEPCPGSIESVRSWYGLRDPDGLFVRDFHICFGDVRKVERLLPSLSGTFVKLPHRASCEKRICAIRTDSNRFSAYLDALVSTHEKAITSRKGADPMPLIDLVERKTRLRECTRDNMLIGSLWHFSPELQSLTICEDCFESVVEPEIKKGASVAKKFTRTVQPVYGEGIGSSCQLYSRRMRTAFQRAVEDNDFKYLARKSKDRREAELWLQDRYKDVVRRAKRLSLEGDVSDDDERRLNRDLEKISTEWKERWE